MIIATIAAFCAGIVVILWICVAFAVGSFDDFYESDGDGLSGNGNGWFMDENDSADFWSILGDGKGKGSNGYY